MKNNLNISAKQDRYELQQFLTFSVNAQEYAVDIMSVLEIKGWTETTRLPNVPQYLRGVINLRGLIIPIFDLKSRFHNSLTEATPKHVVIMLNIDNRSVGILVDSVSDILNITSDQIKPAPTQDMQTEDEYVTGLLSLENRTVVLIDVRVLFTSKHLEHANIQEN